MQIGEYCNREVVVIHKDETPLDTSRLMRRLHVGDVIIVDNVDGDKTPLGIITDRDIALEIVAADIDPAAIAAIDIVRRPLVTVNETDDISECIVCMKHNGIRRLPVVDDDGLLVGVITADDILEIVTEQLNDLIGLVNCQLENEKNMLV